MAFPNVKSALLAMELYMPGQITDIPGLLAGCVEDKSAMTGLTVLICGEGALFAAKMLGPATSTRQADAGRCEHLVDKVHAVCLTGGSAFGLGASGGVMEYLRQKGIGNKVRHMVIPTVPTAALFDLGVGNMELVPDAKMALRACETAGKKLPRGSFGAGCGATVGKSLGPQWMMKGGQGTASIATAGGVVIGALAAVNAYGDVVDARSGRILAGARDPGQPDRIADVPRRLGVEISAAKPSPLENTTLAVVAVGADLDKRALARVCTMAGAGLARSIIPSHCVFDGDVIFALATGGPKINENEAGHLAACALAEAVADAVRCADGFGVVPDRRMIGEKVLGQDA